MLCYITIIIGISINLHFTATSHGKGAVIGVGGCLKRRLQENIKARQVDPSSTEELAKYAAKLCPNISMLFVSIVFVDRYKSELHNYGTLAFITFLTLSYQPVLSVFKLSLKIYTVLLSTLNQMK